MRDEVLGHEVALGQQRGAVCEPVGPRTLAEVEMLRQSRLLQRRRQRFEREHLDAREEEGDGSGTFRGGSRRAGGEQRRVDEPRHDDADGTTERSAT